MKPEKILARPPKVLCQSQREQFFHDGYLVIDQFIGQDWLDRLWGVTMILSRRAESIQSRMRNSILNQSTALKTLDCVD